MEDLVKRLQENIGRYAAEQGRYSTLSSEEEALYRQLEEIEERLLTSKQQLADLTDSEEKLLAAHLSEASEQLVERNDLYESQRERREKLYDEVVLQEDSWATEQFPMLMAKGLSKAVEAVRPLYEKADQRDKERVALFEELGDELVVDIVAKKTDSKLEVYVPVPYQRSEEGLMGNLIEMFGMAFLSGAEIEEKIEDMGKYTKFVINGSYNAFLERLQTAVPSEFNKAKVRNQLILLGEDVDPSSGHDAGERTVDSDEENLEKSVESALSTRVVTSGVQQLSHPLERAGSERRGPSEAVTGGDPGVIDKAVDGSVVELVETTPGEINGTAAAEQEEATGKNAWRSLIEWEQHSHPETGEMRDYLNYTLTQAVTGRRMTWMFSIMDITESQDNPKRPVKSIKRKATIEKETLDGESKEEEIPVRLVDIESLLDYLPEIKMYDYHGAAQIYREKMRSVLGEEVDDATAKHRLRARQSAARKEIAAGKNACIYSLPALEKGVYFSELELERFLVNYFAYERLQRWDGKLVPVDDLASILNTRRQNIWKYVGEEKLQQEHIQGMEEPEITAASAKSFVREYSWMQGKWFEKKRKKK